MPTPAMGMLPISRRVTLQTCPRDSQQEGLYSLKASGRLAHQEASTKAREEAFHPHAAKDGLLATLRCPVLPQKLGTLRSAPYVAWSDYIKEPGPHMKACSLPMWSPCLDTKDVNSSVSSGRFSGSSGGHESCAPFHGPWKERPPLVLGPQRQPRKSNPRLEQLRDKIRAQAQWQASCASLGTSVPSSASCLYKTSSTMLRRKTPKVTNALPVTTCPGSDLLHAAEHRSKDRAPFSLGRELSRFPQRHTSVPRTNIKRIRSASYKREIPKSSVLRRTARGRDSELAGVYAWRKGQALVRRLLGPPPALPRLQGKVPATDLGSDKKAAAVGDLPTHTWLSKPTCARGDQQACEHTPSLASHDQSATIQGAMEILQDLRQQIQAGLELARHSRVARKLSSSKPKPQNLAGKRQQGPQSTWDMQGSFSKSACTATERKCSSLDRAGNLTSRQHWGKAMAEPESCPQRAWTAQGQDTSFQKPGSTPEKPSSFSQRPWSALAWKACPQRAWEAQGQDTAFQTSGSSPKKPSPFSQRPWSALDGQTCPQGTSTACKDWEVPGSSPWGSVAKPQPALHQPWSSFCTQRSSPYSKGQSAVPPPSKAKLAWPEPSQGLPPSKPAKEQDTQEPPPCARTQQSLGRPHSSESLRDFIRRKAQARRQQAMEQKALATHTLELRNRRLQEVYRKQREAILGKAAPVVSRRSPGIVTFVPSSVQSGGLEAPGSLGSPLQKWSKVTSGMVRGDQEAPDSFCLCLNKPWNRAETQDAGRPRDGMSAAPLLPSTASSPGPMKLQDMSGGLCIYMDPQDTEHLGPSGLLHFQYKQARLQALETMADVLKQRIDILTTKLHKSTSPEPASDLASDMLPLGPSTEPVTPAFTPPSYLRSLVSDGGRGTSQDRVGVQTKPLLPSTYFQDGEMLSWRPNREPQSVNLGTHIESQPQGPVSSAPVSMSHTQPCPAGSSSHGARELEKKLQREMATLQALGASMRSSLGVPAAPAPACDSLCQEKMPEAKKAGLVTPWTTHSCGQQEPKGPHSGGLHEGHLTNFQLKSLSFLESLKLDQQKQEQALALLRQQAEHEVWEMQMTLDALLFKHQLKTVSSQQKMEKPEAQQKPEKASRLEQQQMCGGLEPNTLSLNTMTTRSRSPPSPQRDSTGSLEPPEEARASSAGPSQGLLSLSEPEQQDPAHSQVALAKFYPSDRPAYKWSITRPEPGTERSRTFHRFTMAMLEQSLRDEELRAQHQTAVLRLRELALEEKARAELTCLEHQIGCLVGRGAAQATLREKQQQALSRLEKERREIQSLRKVSLSLHHGRKQLLQHQQCVLDVQRSVAHLQQELQARTRLLQSSSPSIKVTRGGVSDTNQKIEGHRPGSPQGYHPQEISESAEAANLSPEQKEVTPPQTTSVADEHLQPPRVKWAIVTPGTGHLPVRSGPDSQEPGKQPCVSSPGLLHSSSLDPEHQKHPAFPVIKKDDSPGSQLKPLEAKELPPPGHLQNKPSAAWAMERQPTDLHAWSLHGQCGQSLSGDGPCPEEARVAENRTSQGLAVSRSPREEPQEEAHWRREACPQENLDIPSTHPEADQEAASPAAPVASEEEAWPAWHLNSPLSQPAVDACSEFASSGCSGSSEAPAFSLTPSAGSSNGLSCPSLQEFQRATATLVQLSSSSASLSNGEAEASLHADPGWSRELSAHDSWEEPGLPSFWGLHQGLPQLEGVSGDVGQVTLQRLGDGGARLLSGFSEDAAVAPGSEPGYDFLQAGWPSSFPRVPSPRLGSELSESSSQIWDENNEETLEEPSPGVGPPSGSSLPANGSLDTGGSGGPCTTLPSLGPGEEQDPSRSSRSLTGTLNTGKTGQMSPVTTSAMLPPQNPSTSDPTLPLSFPVDTPTTERAGLSKGNMPPEASAGCQEEPRDVDTSPSIERKPLQALPDPRAPMTLNVPSEDTTPLVTEVASPSYVDGFLTEILSPVDEELSYGSRDLPSSICGDTQLPLPPPTPQAKSDINEPSPSSEDFPSPPEEVMFPGDSLDTLGEDLSITAEDMSSLSEGALEEALSLGPQESGHCVGASGQDESLNDSSSTSPLSNCAPETSPRLSTQPLSPPPVACVTRENLEDAPGSQSGPWEARQCLEDAEHRQGIEHLIDRRAATSSPSWGTPSESPPPDPVPLVAGSLKHASEKEREGQSCWTQGRHKLQGLLDRQQLCRRNWAFDPTSGACADFSGTRDAGPVDMVSTQLSRRILCDSLAALSGLAPEDSP
ncbi:coiled-coil domain-containing protein 187 isoform X3 [Mesocricetus auratus]|uniref:Coiled-coil domain-containing protein 187 isoform X3 n=1 Tax=Mesocricetus auratus TaxID=10036 RepID=A0ABM2XED4_MESAU|nr:coiled-coil domain-containing protein 187 isoform X3 [Mesocricetus auratus]